MTSFSKWMVGRLDEKRTPPQADADFAPDDAEAPEAEAPEAPEEKHSFPAHKSFPKPEGKSKGFPPKHGHDDEGDAPEGHKSFPPKHDKPEGGKGFPPKGDKPEGKGGFPPKGDHEGGSHSSVPHADIDRWLKSVDGLAKELQALKGAKDKATDKMSDIDKKYNPDKLGDDKGDKPAPFGKKDKGDKGDKGKKGDVHLHFHNTSKDEAPPEDDMPDPDMDMAPEDDLGDDLGPDDADLGGEDMGDDAPAPAPHANPFVVKKKSAPIADDEDVAPAPAPKKSRIRPGMDDMG